MPTKRPTISDIAKAAGVSTGAVSYALNNRPGVSEPTRRRIRDIADRLGWAPSSAARSLSAARADAIGLVVRAMDTEPYFLQFLAGVQGALDTTALVLQVTDDPRAELAAYRRWWAERRVDGVILVDLLDDDPRLALVRELAMPAVAVGDAADLPAIRTDDATAVTEVLDYLAALGHRRVVRVAGPTRFRHTTVRTDAFERAAGRLRIDEARVVHADYTAESAARACRRVLMSADRPTAMILDNDVMAVAALGVAQELGIAVPDGLSLVAWDDSPLCDLVRPALTAVRTPIAERGAAAVRLLLDLVAGVPPRTVRTSDPELVPRSTTTPLRCG
ncbi:LacI family DNA-binding transcriptional regulator [Saccharothrix violaceirubra]|uniref:DNA-binding LacI/PurR family transcriptional regulator n=1 Tax=Saccharothrix violaceirubra TaxID=413306 RepID=A0A7W7T5Q6_9PSEU|nr:LacI family DNA-binding transcriptional regulator [Saccharothrix violaceirubra]MBB4967074.1 DNA-binding LacI/PurR family transcriptional regulator [Saccharothrix violaceirubra]